MRSHWKALAPLAVALLLAACGSSDSKTSGSTAKDVTVPPDAVAIVDGKPILKKDFDALMNIAVKSQEQSLGKDKAPKPGSAEYDNLRQQAMAVLLQRFEIRAEADKAGIKVDQAKVDQSLKDAIKAAGGQKEWDKRNKEAGTTDADYLVTYELQQLAQGLFDKVTKDVKVTDADIKADYDKNRETTYKIPRTRKVAHILLDVNGNSKPDAKDLAKAQEVLALVNGGGNFAQLAKKYSADPGSKDNGGQYDEQEGQFVKEFEKAAFALKTGEWTTAPVKSQFGYHIIKALGDLKPAGFQKFEDVKEQIRATLEQDKKNKTVGDWFEKVQAQYESRTTFATGYSLPPKAPAATDPASTESASSSTATSSSTTG